jgi:hypothetical protein
VAIVSPAFYWFIARLNERYGVELLLKERQRIEGLYPRMKCHPGTWTRASD